jgi:hypothetical protein
MKKLLSFLAFVAVVSITKAQNSMGVGTTNPNPNAVLELISPTKDQGFLVPKVTTIERTATSFTSKLTNTDNGLMVFDTDESKFYFWFSGAWQPVSNNTIADGSITTIKIADGAITNAKIASVDFSKIANIPADLADGDNVGILTETDPVWTTAKTTLASAGTINTGSNLIDWTQLKNVPIEIADGTDAVGLTSVTSGDIVDATITTADLADDAVSTLKIADGAISNSKIADVDFSKITNVPADLADGDDVGIITEIDPVWSAYKDTISSVGVINSGTNFIDWTRLKNVPADFADGFDDGQQIAIEIPVDPIVNMLATDVQAALEELQIKVDTTKNSEWIKFENSLSYGAGIVFADSLVVLVSQIDSLFGTSIEVTGDFKAEGNIDVDTVFANQIITEDILALSINAIEDIFVNGTLYSDTVSSTHGTFDSLTTHSLAVIGSIESDTVYSKQIFADSIFSQTLEVLGDAYVYGYFETDSLFSFHGEFDSLFTAYLDVVGDIITDTIYTDQLIADSIFTETLIVNGEVYVNSYLESDTIFSYYGDFDSLFAQNLKVFGTIETDTTIAKHALIDSLFTQTLQVLGDGYVNSFEADTIFSYYAQFDSLFANNLEVISTIASDTIQANQIIADSLFTQTLVTVGDNYVGGNNYTQGAVFSNVQTAFDTYAVADSDHIIELNSAADMYVTLPSAFANQGRELIFVIAEFTNLYNLKLDNPTIESFVDSGRLGVNDLVMAGNGNGFSMVQIRAIGDRWYIISATLSAFGG